MKKWIVALDVRDEATAFAWADAWSPSLCALKVGLEAYARFGSSFVRQLISRGYDVFLDLKFHDIPNTVASACAAAADLGVWMLNVHASGGERMMEAARDALLPFGKDKPYLIGVTVLTSLGEHDLPALGITQSLDAQVLQLASSAQNAGLDGVVCGAHEVPQVKARLGENFLTVTPGIRITGTSTDDQARYVTPKEADALGSDYGVIGRSVTKASNPTAVLKTLVSDVL